MEGLKKRSEGFSTRSQFDRMRLSIHPHDSSRSRRCALESLQNIPDKRQLQLLLFGNTICPYKERGFVAVFPERRGPFDPGQDTTICGKPIHLEMRIDQHLAPLTEVLDRVGLDICRCLLQAIEESLLILASLLLQDLDVLVGLPFVGAEQQEVSFSRTLGIRDNGICCDGGFHVTPPV